ncbi:MAG: sodium:proton antiporter NhaD [Bacteroidales bacterium]|nr:sodium:proton antiporter NhaD [Bacteroidales bacterium]
MFLFIIILFVAGYICIALEHPLKVNKAATALLLGVVLWILLASGGENLVRNNGLSDFLSLYGENKGFSGWFSEQLVLQLGNISEILFFLLGAMTIVELMDSFEAFQVITNKIKTTHRIKFMWIILIITFFLSAILDNMTSTIVLIALLRKIVAEQKERWFFASMIVLAANAGGAWSPIGDVTTIMLWVSGKVSATGIISATFLASIASIVVPMLIVSLRLKGNFISLQQLEEKPEKNSVHQISKKERSLILYMGTGVLLFVPVFHAFTGLPPYMGILIGLGILWITTEFLQYFHSQRDNSRLSVSAALTRIDLSSILFFLGILLAVGALQVCGHLALLSAFLDNIPLANGKYVFIGYLIGILSAIVDNVPLVAGAMGMYNFPVDHYFWEFVAYCAGTGGSILIIGSAAGVVAMGLEKIDFIWYLKRITLLAFIGFNSGAFIYIVQNYYKIF